MPLPLEVTLRGIENSEAIEAKIRKKVDKLALFYRRIEFCEIVVELEQNHKHQGKLFGVNLEVGVPGKRLVVNHQRNEDLHVAIRDAFAAMRRKVKAYAERQRGFVKAHMEPLVGKVIRIFEDYGFIEAVDGREFYFNAMNVLHPNFVDLEVGATVTFIDSGMGDSDSLQASHVSTHQEEEQYE